jgi:hypothetical protein
MPEPAPQPPHGVWVKYTNGRLIERHAYSPADAVRFRFDGFEKREPLPEIRRPNVEPPARTATRATTPTKTTTRPATPPADPQ